MLRTNAQDRWVLQEGPVIRMTCNNTVLTYRPKKRTYEDDGSIEYIGDDVCCETQVSVDNSHLKVLKVKK